MASFKELEGVREQVAQLQRAVEGARLETKVVSKMFNLFRTFLFATKKLTPGEFAKWEVEVLVPEMAKVGVELKPSSPVSPSGLVMPNGQPVLISPRS